jgi:hypothetical protein
MLSVRACQSFLVLSTLAVAPAFASRTHRAPTSGHHHHKVSIHLTRHKHHTAPGQRGIDSDRATEIQKALIKQNYLTGTPSGQWDAQTESAMMKYQADHGWQTKLTPDSRALIKLGLGPDHTAGVPAASAVPAAASETASTPAAAPTNTLASAHVIDN